MTQAQLIAAVLEAPPDRKDAILAAIRGPGRTRSGNVKQVAEMLGVCPRTVQNWARQGIISAVRLSRRKIRYSLDDAERLARNGIPVSGFSEAAHA